MRILNKIADPHFRPARILGTGSDHNFTGWLGPERLQLIQLGFDPLEFAGVIINLNR